MHEQLKEVKTISSCRFSFFFKKEKTTTSDFQIFFTFFLLENAFSIFGLAFSIKRKIRKNNLMKSTGSCGRSVSNILSLDESNRGPSFLICLGPHVDCSRSKERRETDSFSLKTFSVFNFLFILIFINPKINL